VSAGAGKKLSKEIDSCSIITTEAHIIGKHKCPRACVDVDVVSMQIQENDSYMDTMLQLVERPFRQSIKQK
jgi:hypothetical protein